MNPDAFIREQAHNSAAIATTNDDNQFGQAPSVNLLFIDSSVDNVDALIAQVKQGTQVIVLNNQSDGISQITDALSDYQNVSSLSVVSHGQSGQLQLGSSTVSSAVLSQYRDEFQSWQTTLTDNADILFYGCNVAAGQKGANFLNQFGQLTGADIAASTDLTGSAALGGDWELEYARGEIETESPFSPKLVQSYDSVLAQYKFEGTSYRLHSKTKHGVNTVKNPSGSGDATRIELRYDDPWVSNKRRAEVIPSVGKLKWGSTYTYELSKFIPNSWKGDSRFEILMQWHQQPDKGERWGNPPMVLDASGNQIRLRTTIEQGSKKVKKTLWSAKLEKGSWIDYKFEINWSKNSNGYVKAWQNGEQIVNHKGQTANNDQEVPFMKYGIYKHNWESKSTERVLYFKNFDFSEGSSSSNGGTKPVGSQSIVSPTAKDDTFTTNEDSSLTGNVLTGSGVDLAGTGSLAVVGNTNPANGSVTIQEDGNFIYTPKADFYGSDSFTYTVKNTSGGTDTATVTLTVKDINDRPTASGTIPTQEVMDGSTVNLDVSSYFSDRDGTIASYTVKGLPKGLSIDNKGIISGTIDSNANVGSQDYTVTIEAKDNDGATVNQSFQYTVRNPDPVQPDPVQPTSFRVEAESLKLNTYRFESRGFASGGKLISLTGGKGKEVGKATYVHKGGSGTFDIDLRYFDENDGASRIKVRLNGKQIDQWSLNERTKENIASVRTSRIHTLESITLADGDRLEIMGYENNREHVRIDYLDFKSVAPQPEAIRVEAEDLAVNNYRSESHAYASGGKILSLVGKRSGEVGRATYTHTGAAGTYDFNLSYFDENDGVSTFKVLLNGKQIDAWSLDENPDGPPVSAATERMRTINGLNLKKGDRLTIVGAENAAEHARIDYLELTPALLQSLAA